MLALRFAINRIIRDEMEARGFLEVETPLLGRSTPEGARDFLVPSRLWPGTFYALPQSPQQLKQLLVVAGQDRYYQIVRCLRDEQTQADRSFEFTQLDVEMSFVDEEDVFAVIEPLYARIVREIQGVEVATPFPRMTFDEMMDRYGSDKPDLRYGMELTDVGDVFAGTGFRAFASVLGPVASSRPSRPPVARSSPERSSTAWSRSRSRGRRRPGLDRRGERRDPLAGREAPVARRDRPRATGDRSRSRRPHPDRGGQARPDERRARRAPPPSRRSARADPGGCVAVLLVLRASAVRLVGRRGQVGVESPSVHVAADRRPDPRDGQGARPTTSR